MIIKEQNNLGILGVSLWSEETLQAIYKDSGELAKDNEFQVHYWALNMVKTYEDDSKICFSFPLVIFNYKQEVGMSSIDFELKDVEEMSDKLKPIALTKGDALYKEIKDKFKGYEAIITPLNTLHRHP